MKSGRPPAWLLDGTDDRVLQDAVRVDDRGRFTFPSRLLSGFPGINESGSGKVLVEARYPGCVVLRPWEGNGDAVMGRRDELKESLNDIRALDDVFQRGRLEPCRRFELQESLLGHLSASFRVEGVFLVRYVNVNRIEIISRDYRSNLLREAPNVEFG